MARRGRVCRRRGVVFLGVLAGAMSCLRGEWVYLRSALILRTRHSSRVPGRQSPSGLESGPGEARGGGKHQDGRLVPRSRRRFAGEGWEAFGVGANVSPSGGSFAMI